MIFFFACILILSAVIMFFVFLKTWLQPKVNATIDEVIEEEKNWWSKKSNKIVTLSFDYKSVDYRKKRAHIIAQDVLPGENIKLCINPRKPIDFKPYKPKFELLAVSVLALIGSGLLWFCFFVIDWLG